MTCLFHGRGLGQQVEFSWMYEWNSTAFSRTVNPSPIDQADGIRWHSVERVERSVGRVLETRRARLQLRIFVLKRGSKVNRNIFSLLNYSYYFRKNHSPNNVPPSPLHSSSFVNRTSNCSNYRINISLREISFPFRFLLFPILLVPAWSKQLSYSPEIMTFLYSLRCVLHI